MAVTGRLYDVQTGKEVQSFSVHRDYVWGLSFSLDGRVLAMSAGDGQISLWRRWK
jgi:WD40 repeat protein